jgi:uncharacterized membrane protein YcaP (DUF421 family)
MSIEELLGELRQNSVSSIDEVYYAILENNGKLSVIPKVQNRTVETKDLEIDIEESGIAHAVIIDGTIKKEALEGSGLDERWLEKVINKENCKKTDIFLMTVDDTGKTNIIKKEK